MADESKSAAAAGGAEAGMAEMPKIGTGTMEHVDGSHPTEAIYDATLAALKAGSRLVDTAELYKSAPHVGRAIAASAVPRGELWVTSKLCGMPSGDFDAVKARVDAHLKDLQLDQVDLLLMHWPGAATVPGKDEGAEGSGAMDGSPDDLASACDFAWFQSNLKQAWANMQALREAGLCRFIGVSNFYGPHIDAMSAAGLEPPYADQVFVDAAHPETELVTALQGKGIRVMAYRCLAFLPVIEMAGQMGDAIHAALKAAADATGAASVHQLVLAAMIARGITPLCKSASAERCAANLAAAGVEVPAATLSSLLEAAAAPDMVNMCGGQDEYAAAMSAAGSAKTADAADAEGSKTEE